MGYWGLWVIRAMGYGRVDCTVILSNVHLGVILTLPDEGSEKKQQGDKEKICGC